VTYVSLSELCDATDTRGIDHNGTVVCTTLREQTEESGGDKIHRERVDLVQLCPLPFGSSLLNRDIPRVSGSACSGVSFWFKNSDMGLACPALRFWLGSDHGKVTKGVLVDKDMQHPISTLDNLLHRDDAVAVGHIDSNPAGTQEMFQPYTGCPSLTGYRDVALRQFIGNLFQRFLPTTADVDLRRWRNRSRCRHLVILSSTLPCCFHDGSATRLLRMQPLH